VFRSQGVALGWISMRLWRWNMNAHFGGDHQTNPQGVALGWIDTRLWRWNMMLISRRGAKKSSMHQAFRCVRLGGR
jgi:hypothetical protein